MFWVIAALLAFTKFAAGLHLRDVERKTEAEYIDAEEDWIDTQETAAEDIHVVEEDITEEQKDLKDLEAEIIQTRIERSKAETAFEVEQTEWEMESSIARARAARGASGLTAVGSPVMVLQEVTRKYERLIEHREAIGGLEVEQLETGGEIIGGQKDIMDLQSQIADLRLSLQTEGFQYQRDVLDIQTGFAEFVAPWETAASILDLGTDLLGAGYAGSKKKKKAYQSPFGQ